MKRVCSFLLIITMLLSCDKKEIAINSILLPNEISVNVGNIHKVEVSHYPSELSPPKYIWKSLDTDIFVVNDSGIINALKIGEGILSVEAVGLSLITTCKVKVLPIKAESISITPATIDILLGDTYKLEATLNPVNTTTKKISWKSSNENIVTVTNEGLIEAVGLGSAVITASSENITGECEINVKPIEASNIYLDTELVELIIGYQKKMTVTIEPENVTNKTAIWTSNNDNIAKINEEGIISAVGIGEAIITVKSGMAEANCTVKVIPVNVETPGTLNSFYNDEQKQKITNLSISGSLNEFDFLAISEMPALKLLDISMLDNISLPKRAFENNNIIEEVKLPNFLKEIPDFLFHKSKILKCTIPPTVERIGSGAFSYSSISGLLVMPNNLKVIGNESFSFCDQLTEVELNEGLIRINSDAFRFCTNLNTVNIPSTVTSIGYRAFNYCINLTGDLIIPPSVKTIEDAAFYGCPKITGLYLSEGLEYLGGAFGGCTGINNKLIIPSTVKFIGRDAFWSCSGITGDLIIPNSVQSIGVGAFLGTNLNKIYSKSKTPPTIDDYWGKYRVFTESKYLGVPKGSKDSYKEAPYWKDFLVVEEVDFEKLDL